MYPRYEASEDLYRCFRPRVTEVAGEKRSDQTEYEGERKVVVFEHGDWHMF